MGVSKAKTWPDNGDIFYVGKPETIESTFEFCCAKSMDPLIDPAR